MPSSFNDTLAASGSGTTSPLRFNEPAPSIRVSRATVTGLARSRLTPSTFKDNGANSTFAAGEVLRSSAEMLASRTANSRRSNFHGGAAEAGAAAGPGAAAAGVDTGGTGGDRTSFNRLNDPSGSSHVTSFTPVSDSESAWACGFGGSSGGSR